jgi:hypothetical protein
LSSLPGASLALLKEQDQVDDDTQQIDLSNLSWRIQVELKQYFEQKEYRSVAAIVLRHPVDHSQLLGVMSIASNQPKVLGDSDTKKTEIKGLIRPLVLLLEMTV